MLIPEQCLGSSLCHRKENGAYRASTVQDVVAQFDKLVKTVLTTCVGDLSSTAQDRALRFEHWIHVAKVCLGPLGTLSKVCIPMSEWKLLDSSWHGPCALPSRASLGLNHCFPFPTCFV